MLTRSGDRRAFKRPRTAGPVRAGPSTSSAVSKMKHRIKPQYKASGKLAKAIAKVNMQMKELKWKDWSYANTNLYHNKYASGYQLQLLTAGSTIWPAQGSGTHTREGNEIFVTGITIRAQVNFVSDRLNSKVHLYVVKIPRGQAISAYEDMFDNITGNVNLDPIDQDKVKVLAKRTVWPGVLNPGVPTTGKDVTRYARIYIPINHKVRFIGDADYSHSIPYDLVLAAIAYDAQGSVITDICGSIACFFRTQWRDL